MYNMKMRYAKQSAGWLEGLPVGNGRLAAMIWGSGNMDFADLNHEWLWRGIHRNRKVTPAAEHLEYVRSLLKKRDFYNGSLETNKYYSGSGSPTEEIINIDFYQTAGFLAFFLEDCTAFEWRELDIETGICRVSRRTSKTAVISEFFVDCNDGLIMSEWRSENGAAYFSGVMSYARIEDGDATYNAAAHGNKLIFDCAFNGGVSFRAVSEFQTDGKLSVAAGCIGIKNASYIRCMTNIATSVFDLDSEISKYPADFSNFENIKAGHIKKFAGIMNGVTLEIAEGGDNSESGDNREGGEGGSFGGLSIEQRLDRMRAGGRDNGVVTLYFNFGRYLMVSSSVCGDLPANLQGKWNNRIDPPWYCEYAGNINLQMNYWMAEPCNMPQCHDKLLKYLESYYESGFEAAQKLYGCRGIYLPAMMDAWGISTPEAFGWQAWTGVAPWFARHFWHRYLYSGDAGFLKNRGYRFIKAAAEFLEDYLVEDEDGVFQIMPSQSPENKFEEALGATDVSACISSAIDVQLAYDALGYAIQAAEILRTDGDKVKIWKYMRGRLPEFKIGADGRLLEWNEEFKESEPGHRHLSHLYGAYPSELFTGENRPAQYEAARKSLEFRLARGGGHTGWSRAWVACLYARFGDAQKFYEHFIALINDFATVTLLDLHPMTHSNYRPGVFQIDGNLGGVAALIESVISYTDNKVHLLRSLPKEWSDGTLQGIKTPGGHTVSLWWKGGRVSRLTIRIGFGGSLTVRVGGADRVFSGGAGDIIDYAPFREP